MLRAKKHLFVKRYALSLIALLLCTTSLLQSLERPRLVIIISIDQMKPEYFGLYKAWFTGGFKRFLSEGTVYTNADLNYAPSETGPGHAALGTGTYPQHSGIVANEWIDHASGNIRYCVEDSSAGAVDGYGGGFSPRDLEVTGIGDWWTKAYPSARVISASIKDRAAILMVGKHADQVYWYDEKSGRMVTSDYYLKRMPEWVQSFNASDWVSHTMPDRWTKLLADSVYARYGPDEMNGEMSTDGSTSFPHLFKPEKKRNQLSNSPFGDAMILDFALAAIRSEKLGQRGAPDLLTIGLSCTDYIGHEYGGNSHEMLDQLIRLDRSLGAFLANVERLLGKGSILIALSSDHGAMPMPEYMNTIEHRSARRIILKDVIFPKIDDLNLTLQRELGTTERIIRGHNYLNYAAAARIGLDSLALERRVKDGLRRIDGVAEVYFRRDILNPANANRPFVGYFQRGYYPPRGKDFMLLPCEFCLFTTSTTGSTHGSPYRYDTHVPIVFWGKGVSAKNVARPVHSVDIAPTIAKMLGIVYPSTIDGKALKEIVR